MVILREAQPTGGHPEGGAADRGIAISARLFRLGRSEPFYRENARVVNTNARIAHRGATRARTQAERFARLVFPIRVFSRQNRFTASRPRRNGTGLAWIAILRSAAPPSG